MSENLISQINETKQSLNSLIDGFRIDNKKWVELNKKLENLRKKAKIKLPKTIYDELFKFYV